MSDLVAVGRFVYSNRKKDRGTFGGEKTADLRSLRKSARGTDHHHPDRPRAVESESKFQKRVKYKSKIA